MKVTSVMKELVIDYQMFEAILSSEKEKTRETYFDPTYSSFCPTRLINIFVLINILSYLL